MLTIIASLFLLGFLTLLNYFNLEDKNRIDHDILQELKKECDSFTLDVSTIAIKHRSWKKEIMVDMYGNKINPNAVRKDGFFEFKKVNEYKSDLTIPISYKGETIEFLTTLYVDGDWLGIKFYQQKETTFYINKKNIENSYIDFRFLENPKIDYTPVHTADFYKDW